ncbi:hypothetical protein [Haloglomus salinum]|uniref:hypothetical protein n=1 Tax=Haloglomus salinum TaxID=2962673 RepID=UPI0020CA0C21|nr:hypothetical protein [Haloglomus salinum]
MALDHTDLAARIDRLVVEYPETKTDQTLFDYVAGEFDDIDEERIREELDWLAERMTYLHKTNTDYMVRQSKLQTY